MPCCKYGLDALDIREYKDTIAARPASSQKDRAAGHLIAMGGLQGLFRFGNQKRLSGAVMRAASQPPSRPTQTVA
jgi:hypothetical protein